MSKEKSGSRKRGVIASRSKLDKAMLIVGLKTQSNLAEKIAQLEGIKTPPKDMVNRAFRQQPVEQRSLERIAIALNVESYELYLTKEDELNGANQHTDANKSDAQQPPLNSDQAPRRNWLPVALSFAVIVVIAWLWWPSEQEKLAKSTLPQNYKIAVIGDLKALDDGLHDYVNDEVKRTFKVVENWSPFSLSDLDTFEFADKLKVDSVVVWEMESAQRHTKLDAFLVSSNSRKLVYTDVHLSASLETIGPQIAARLVDNIKQLISTGEYRPLNGFTSSQEASEQHFLGMQYLNQENTLINVSRAESRFQRALRIDGDYIRAKGGLCTALLRKASLGTDLDMLKDVKQPCESLIGQAESAESLQALGNWYRSEDDLTSADQSYAQALKLNPNNADALFGRAKVKEVLATSARDPQLFNEALEFLNAAIKVEPNGWRGYFSKSRLQYMLGQRLGAIATLEQGKVLSPNFNILNNLGTMYFCAGEMQKATDSFYEITQLERDPSWITEHQLASLYEFLGETDKAIMYVERGMAILEKEGVDGHFEPWITKANAYAAHGDFDTAKESYQKALEVAEQLRVSGVDEGNTYASIIYIEIANEYMIDKTVSEQSATEFAVNLDNAAKNVSSPNAITRLMLGYVMLNQFEKAQPYFNQMQSICPGFVKDPMFDPLRT